MPTDFISLHLKWTLVWVRLTRQAWFALEVRSCGRNSNYPGIDKLQDLRSAHIDECVQTLDGFRIRIRNPTLEVRNCTNDATVLFPGYSVVAARPLINVYVSAIRHSDPPPLQRGFPCLIRAEHLVYNVRVTRQIHRLHAGNISPLQYRAPSAIHNGFIGAIGGAVVHNYKSVAIELRAVVECQHFSFGWLFQGNQREFAVGGTNRIQGLDHGADLVSAQRIERMGRLLSNYAQGEKQQQSNSQHAVLPV